MTKQVFIRDYQEADYPDLMKLWESLDLGRPERGDDRSVIAKTLQHDGKLLVALVENRLIGSAWITNNGRRLYIHHMGVAKGLQRQGIGKRLMEKILEFADTWNMQIKLEVHQTNPHATALYRKYGFEPLSGYMVLINRNTGRKK